MLIEHRHIISCYGTIFVLIWKQWSDMRNYSFEIVVICIYVCSETLLTFEVVRSVFKDSENTFRPAVSVVKPASRLFRGCVYFSEKLRDSHVVLIHERQKLEKGSCEPSHQKITNKREKQRSLAA